MGDHCVCDECPVFIWNLSDCASGLYPKWQIQSGYAQSVYACFNNGNLFCVKWLCYRYDVSKNLKKLICEAGGCVFGIYLTEQLARIQLLPLYLFLSEKTFGVLACTCYVVCSFALARLYTELLKRVPLLRSVL